MQEEGEMQSNLGDIKLCVKNLDVKLPNVKSMSKKCYYHLIINHVATSKFLDDDHKNYRKKIADNRNERKRYDEELVKNNKLLSDARRELEFANYHSSSLSEELRNLKKESKQNEEVMEYLKTRLDALKNMESETRDKLSRAGDDTVAPKNPEAIAGHLNPTVKRAKEECTWKVSPTYEPDEACKARKKNLEQRLQDILEKHGQITLQLHAREDARKNNQEALTVLRLEIKHAQSQNEEIENQHERLLKYASNLKDGVKMTERDHAILKENLKFATVLGNRMKEWSDLVTIPEERRIESSEKLDADVVGEVLHDENYVL